jgi:hypothetical protein
MVFVDLYHDDVGWFSEDIPLEEVWDAASSDERAGFLDYIGGPFGLTDPVKRLEVITELRAQGYKVEPA